MLLINPYYLVLNVQYIDTNRKFIMIDRKVWNRTIVSFNRVRKLEPSDIKRFKKEIYNMYLSYMRHGRIDYDKFNKMCCELMHVEFSSIDYSSLKKEDEYKFVHDECEVQETPYYDNSKTDVVKLISNGLLDNSFRDTVSTIRNINTLLSEDWNTLMMANEDCDDLLTYVGFGRIRSLVSQVLTSKEAKLYTKEEFVVLYMFRDFIMNLLGDCNIKELMFFCQHCLTVNCHKFRSFGRDKVNQTQCNLEEHNGKMKFFDYTGQYEEENQGYGLKQRLGIDVMGKFTEFKIYHKDSPINPRKFRKYHILRNSLVNEHNILTNVQFFNRSIRKEDFKNFLEHLPICESYYYDDRPLNWELDEIFCSKEYILEDNVYKYIPKIEPNLIPEENRNIFGGVRNNNPFNIKKNNNFKF
jgi:hypothetical protein